MEKANNVTIVDELGKQLALTIEELKNFNPITNELHNLNQFLSCLDFKLSKNNNLVFIFNNSDSKENSYDNPTQVAAALNSSIALIQEKSGNFFNTSKNIDDYRSLYDKVLNLIYSLQEAEKCIENSFTV